MGWMTWLRGRRAMANVLAAAACFALIGYALYAEHWLGLEPCPLCMFQRVGVVALGGAFVLAALLALARARLAGFIAVALVFLAAAVTVGVAGRHVYVQSQPAGTFESCGASLDWMLQINPLLDVVRKVLSAPGDCANVDWDFLGLSMPGWVLAWALLLGVLGVLVNWPGRAAARR